MKGKSLNEQRIKVIACATVIEEMLPYLPPHVTTEVLDFGLHRTPEKLREALQEAINKNCNDADVILLGYGLCSMGVVGLSASTSTLVVPRVDDCIAIFLGSNGAYRKQSEKEPGTFYLTKGWIEVCDTPDDEYNRLIERYGRKRADRVMEVMFQHYKRLLYIDTGQADQERYRDSARQNAKRLNLRYEEIPGSVALIRKMINGPWDDDFVVARPGEKIKFEDFRITASSMPNLNRD
jgi:hypothetical protein